MRGRLSCQLNTWNIQSGVLHHHHPECRDIHCKVGTPVQNGEYEQIDRHRLRSQINDKIKKKSLGWAHDNTVIWGCWLSRLLELLPPCPWERKVLSMVIGTLLNRRAPTQELTHPRPLGGNGVENWIHASDGTGMALLCLLPAAKVASMRTSTWQERLHKGDSTPQVHYPCGKPAPRTFLGSRMQMLTSMRQKSCTAMPGRADVKNFWENAAGRARRRVQPPGCRWPRD